MPASQSEAPPPCSVRSRTPKKSFVFLLEEKIGRAQIKNCKEYFAWRRALASGGGAASLIHEFLIK
ncbi:hypothetical protein COX11_02860 [Candidatus Berkelbacteria bacterium CG23_combo_of_CG06-09_8_20_14_all_41_73]|uniref:Uncharacterized protein n=1 Tax=Candidatus Berkelbacteria bacterium CG23_combo_of_CG06-09_8_20_14_all_41_73 TaxID=1974519 RepID=A0A2H0B0S9_9BACT|nr:MAG: hypothetical protein COX11_02860 [Candidatus Berkelbacteria bacterium CG23_combo_of_CG06-09_8_20_14_all_41_73]